MKKIEATRLLSATKEHPEGTTSKAAEALGITFQAYWRWPDDLTQKMDDRVQAAIARKHLPPFMLGISVEEAKA